MQNISEIEELIKLISKLPGLGPKSAKRIVLKLINNRDELVKPMASTLAQVYKNVIRCNSCGSLKSNVVGCYNCNTNEKLNKICDKQIQQISGSSSEIRNKVIRRLTQKGWETDLIIKCLNRPTK